MNMMICNEIEMRTIYPPTDSCTGIIYQETFGRVLASITEFTVDVQIMDQFTNPFTFMHGNKHIEDEAKILIQKEMYGFK